VFSLDAARKMAAVYIDTGEKVATDAIEFRRRRTNGQRHAASALLEVQTSMGRKTSRAFGRHGPAPVANRGRRAQPT